MKNLKVDTLIVCKQSSLSKEYETIIQLAKEKRIKIKVVTKGDKIDIEPECSFQILHPTSFFIDDGKGGLNANAITAKLTYKKFSMLLTGDIEEKSEKLLLQEYQNTNLLKSDILKVAHHGSKSSSSEEFLKTVKPQISLIGVGKKNTFGHPNENVLKRIKQTGSKIYRTDLQGEIRIQVNKKGKIKVETQIKK